MLTSIDTECSTDVHKNIKVQSSSTCKSNVVFFKSLEVSEAESRKKAIEAIRKRSQQLHW